MTSLEDTILSIYFFIFFIIFIVFFLLNILFSFKLYSAMNKKGIDEKNNVFFKDSYCFWNLNNMTLLFSNLSKYDAGLEKQRKMLVVLLITIVILCLIFFPLFSFLMLAFR